MAASAVAWLEVLLEGLSSGTKSWAAWDASLDDTPDRTEIAISRCGAELARARERLRALNQSGQTGRAPGTELRRMRPAPRDAWVSRPGVKFE